MSFHPLGNLVIPATVTPAALPDPVPLPGNTYRPWRGNFFMRVPSPADVIQGNIGDCYLVASLQAILARPCGPALIQEMVKDEGTSVVLKMHKDQAWHYVRISKSLPGKTFFDRDHSRGAKWVQFFEKAFAAFAKNGSYEQLARGGDNLAAVDVFLGGHENVPAPPEASLNALHMLTDQPEPSEMAPKMKAKLEHLLSQQIGLSAAEVTDWFTWRDNNKLEAASFKDCYHPPYILRFDQVVEKYAGGPRPLNAVLKKKILDWYKRVVPIPGVVGSGLYTPGQVDFFMKVQRAIATQRSVGVETKNKGAWAEMAPAMGLKATGESTLKGLGSDHAYSVVDTKVDGARRYFLVRNPWGNYRRDYEERPDGTLIPKAKSDSGDSWIELADFFVYFQPAFAEGPPVHDRNRSALMTDLEGQLQREIARRTLRNWGQGLD